MATKQQVYIKPEKRHLPRWLTWLVRFVIRRGWYTHSPVVLVVGATPQLCLQTLKTSARPSTQRLHQRNLFASGRRYFVQDRKGGFRMTTTSSVRWRYRKRTAAIVVMWGDFARLDENTTRIKLRSRINTGFLLDTFLLPGFMTSILIYMPWHPLVITVGIGTLLMLSWIAHRTNARLETNEMIWYTQKALEDLVPAEILALNPSTIDMMDADFSREWEKFYREHRDG